MTLEGIGVLAPERSDAAMAVQTLAFAADPVMRWLFPEPELYVAVFPRFARAFGGAAFEHERAHGPSDLGGAAFWLPAGVAPDPAPIVRIIEQDVRPSIRDDSFSVLEQMERCHIDEPHEYLAMIGVDPARRGLGLGASILQHNLRSCDEQGLPAYLESSNPANLSLYQRHGFELMGEIQAGDSPPIFPMIRRP